TPSAADSRPSKGRCKGLLAQACEFHRGLELSPVRPGKANGPILAMLIEMIRIFSYHYFPTNPIIAALNAKTIDRADWQHLLSVVWGCSNGFPVTRSIRF